MKSAFSERSTKTERPLLTTPPSKPGPSPMLRVRSCWQMIQAWRWTVLGGRPGFSQRVTEERVWTTQDGASCCYVTSVLPHGKIARRAFAAAWSLSPRTGARALLRAVAKGLSPIRQPATRASATIRYSIYRNTIARLPNLSPRTRIPSATGLGLSKRCYLD